MKILRIEKTFFDKKIKTFSEVFPLKNSETSILFLNSYLKSRALDKSKAITSSFSGDTRSY